MMPKELIGTQLQGYIKEASYSDLCVLLGAPQQFGTDGKTRASWLLQDGEVVAHIYDYKAGDVPIEKNIVWHIGGRSHWALELTRRQVPVGVVTDREDNEISTYE